MYKIKLPNFEGPFDLLLYFIKRDELNIYDIPISEITEEFLKYIKIMQYFDLELAGEFILMASTLMYIKAQMLLPRPKGDDDTEIEDPRTGLVRKLLEYKLYKDAASDLAERYEENKYVFYRNLFDSDKATLENSASYKNANLFDLLSAFSNVMQRAETKEPEHHVTLENITVEDKINAIFLLLSSKKRISFYEFTRNTSRMHLIVTLLAILELMKYRKIWIHQDDNFDDIIIMDYKNYNHTGEEIADN
ncbi:MAG: segregation/condensation protein A [Candidatus Kapabacteria bacterium]|nr:segregation/condensation protein A [Ignavibacteriota bacterium]MCW5884389.1 segregation/condensation protein A [Candidatus Kapabacteria bacterium]